MRAFSGTLPPTRDPETRSRMRVTSESHEAHETERPRRYVLDFREIDRTQLALAGGKGANLGELSRIHGIRVPRGFCVTTDAFRRVVSEALSIEGLLETLSHVSADDHEAIRTVSAEIRRIVERAVIPHEIAAAVAAPVGPHTTPSSRSVST